MITTMTTIDANEVPAHGNVRNNLGDEWSVQLSGDPEHMVNLFGTIPQLNDAHRRLGDAIRTCQAMEVARQRSIAQNIATADRALGFDGAAA